MKRRVFLHRATAAATTMAAAAGRDVAAQTGAKVPRIGVLRWGAPSDEARAGLTQALAAVGYRDGQTIEINWRYTTDPVVGRRHAVELAGMDLDLLIGSATPAVQALRAATTKLPIVMATAADAVGAGLVASLARPGGNVTGVSSNLTTMVPKQLQLLVELLPGLRRVAFLGSTDDAATKLFVAQSESAAQLLGLKLHVVLVSQPREFESAVDSMVRERAQALVVQPLFTLGKVEGLTSLLQSRRLPSISSLRPFLLSGGLATYGPSRAEQWSRSASFVDRVLRGAQPATLPVEEPTLFELAFNLKTARALGLTIAQSLLLRADEVIE